MPKIKVDIDFTKSDLVEGTLFLKVVKMTPGTSKNDNQKVDVQCLVVTDPAGLYTNRYVFDTWTITPESMFHIKQALRALLGSECPDTLEEFDTESVIEKTAWCKVVISKGKPGTEYEGTERSQVKTWGVRAPEGAEDLADVFTS